MHIPGRGAFGAAACVQSAVKKAPIKEEAKCWHRVALSLQGHWETAANCLDKQAQRDGSGVSLQRCDNITSGDE